MSLPNELECSGTQDRVTRRDTAWRIARKPVLVILAVLVTAALGVAGWEHRYSRSQGVPPTPARPSQPVRPIAVLLTDSSRTPANAGSDLNATEANEQTDTRPDREISIHPLDQFRDDLRKALSQELAPTYPQLPDLNRETGNDLDQDYRDSVFRFLDAAEKRPEAEQPAMLLAADFMLQALWCPSEQGVRCDQLRNQFAEHQLTLANSQLGGGWYYQHDLLWRVWQRFGSTKWGEQAFILLLDLGWDTSGMCAKGSDQFREVIRQGESFLQQHPNSEYRPFVVHLVGQAYASWWTLSNDPTAAMVDYVDPKPYKEGAKQARPKAIGYFEQILQLSPGTLLGEYARQMLPTLRERLLTVDGYRFFCVYD